MQNDTQIRVNIITAINESGLITSMKKLTDQAKSQAKTLNSVFEQAFKGTQRGVKFGVFQEMLASIKEVSSALKSLPKDMAKTFSTLDRSASTAKKSVDEVSQSLDKVSGKKAKASVDIEIRNAKDVQKVVGEALSKGNFSVGHAKEWVKGVSSSSGVYLTKDQQKNIVQSLTKQYNLDTSAVSGPQIALDTWLKNKESENARAKAYRGAEDRDRSRVNPVTAHQYAMDLQKRQKAPLVESEIIRQKTAYEDKKNFEKLDKDWISSQKAAHKHWQSEENAKEQAKFQAEKDIHKQYQAHLKQQAQRKIEDDQTAGKLQADLDKAWISEQKAMHKEWRRQKDTAEQIQFEKEKAIHQQYIAHIKAKSDDTSAEIKQRAKEMKEKPQFTPISEAYLDKARWAKGQFSSGDAFAGDAKAYMKYAIKDLGMSLQDVMKSLRASAPGRAMSSYVNPVSGLIGGQSEQDRFFQSIAEYGAKITNAKSPVDSMGKSIGLVNDLMRKQGEAVLRLGRYYTSFFLITSSIQQMNEAWRQSVLVQEEMLELQKFLPEGSNVGAMRGGVYNMAAEFGVPIDTVLGAYTEFAKQGKKANEIIELTKSALLGVNVASTDFATTVTYLTTVTNVWKDQFSDTSVLIDKLAIVQAKSSASSEVLISAMQRSASMAKTMGVSLDQLFGYISAVSEKTQLSGEVIGNSLKTIFERTRRDKTIQMLESIPALSGAGLRTPITQELASAPRILDLVAQKWKILTDVQQRNIAFQMAGGRQINSFMALMENMGRATEITGNSIDSLNYAFNANNLELQKFSKAWQSLQTRMYEIGSSAIIPTVKYLGSFLKILTSISSVGMGFNKFLTGFSLSLVAFSAVSVLASKGIGSFAKALASPMVGGLIIGTFSAIKNLAIGMLTLNGAALSSAIGLGKFATAAKMVSQGWALMFGTSMLRSIVGTKMALSGLLAIVTHPLLVAVAAVGAGYMAWQSTTESTVEKQQQLNEKLQQALALHKQIGQAQTMGAREDISYQMSKDLTSEEFSKNNFPAEWSKKYNRYIFPYSSEEALKSTKKDIQAAEVGSVKATAISDKALGEWLNAFMPKIEATLGKEFMGKPDDLTRILKLLYESTNKTTASFRSVNIMKPDINDIRGKQALSILKSAESNGKPVSLSSSNYLALKRLDYTQGIGARDNEAAIDNIFGAKLISNKMTEELSKVKPISFYKLFDGKGVIEEISRYRTAFAGVIPEELLDQKQIDETTKQYKDDIKNITFLKKKQYEEEAKGQRDNLSITRATSNAQMSSVIVGLKDIARLEKQINEAKMKMTDPFYEGATGEDNETEDKIKNLQKQLIGGREALQDIMGGQSPTDIARSHIEFIKKTLAASPAEQIKIYEDWAMNQTELLKNALKASTSAGQVDESMTPDMIKRNLNIQMMSDQFQQEIMTARKAREATIKAQQMDIKYAKDVYLSVAEYGIEVDRKIQEYFARPTIKAQGMSEWVKSYDRETEDMVKLMQSREQYFKSNQDKMSSQEAARERSELQKMKGKIEKRTDARGRLPFISEDYKDISEITKFSEEQGRTLAKNIKKGISPEFLSSMAEQIDKLKGKARAEQISLEDKQAKGMPTAVLSPIKEEISLLQQKQVILESNLKMAEAYQYKMAPAEAEKKALEIISQKVDLKRQEMSINGELLGTATSLLNYNIAEKEIHSLKSQLLAEQIRQNDALLLGKNDEANKMNESMQSIKNLIGYWEKYRDGIYNITPAIASFSSSFLSSLQNIQRETQTGISFVDNLSSRLYALAGQVFSIAINFVISKTGDGTGLLDGLVSGAGKAIDFTKKKTELEKGFKALNNESKKIMAGTFQSAALANLQNFAKSIGIKENELDPNDPRVQGYLKQIEDTKKTFSAPDQSGARAAERDRESTAHYNALERIKKAEADLQKQQQMSSYWEGKMPDKYLLKYDAETAKYNAELKAKQAALDSERANLKPEEVKKLQEEINVLQEKVNLQSKYRQQAEEIATFEKWQSDNRVGMERLRTELSIKSEIYDMEYAALYSPSRTDEKSYMEWKIKSAITELEAQRLIAIEEQKIVAIKNGKSEAEALSIAMSTEEVQLLDIKLQKEQQMLGLIDRQLELKQKQKINEQVREVQGMISSGIFDALSLKSKSERKKQLAELAQELSKLSGESETASYGIAQAESAGNIDSINSARSKWNEVNKQIEEARKKMDEVNNSTNKWKEVLQNIGDSVLKKLSDKFAEMLINKTGLGDIFGSLFGGIDKIGSGGKSNISAPSLSDPRTALGTLALGGLGGVAKGKGGIMDMFMPGISNSSIQYNISAAGGAGNPLGSLLGGGLNFGGGAKLPANYVAGARNGYTGRGIDASSAAKKYGTSQYLTSAMLGYAIGSSTSNRAVGALGGAAAGFLTGGPIGAIIGGLAGLFGRKKDDTPPPVQPQREFYALFRNSESLDRNTSALQKLSEGVFNSPSTFEVNKLQAERNMTSPTFNITINATSNSPKAIASEVNAVISNSYQTSLAKTATSTSNWG